MKQGPVNSTLALFYCLSGDQLRCLKFAISRRVVNTEPLCGCSHHSQEFMNTARMAEAVAEGLLEAGCEVELFNTNEGRYDGRLGLPSRLASSRRSTAWPLARRTMSQQALRTA
jgi:hypothetical protein